MATMVPMPLFTLLLPKDDLHPHTHHTREFPDSCEVLKAMDPRVKGSKHTRIQGGLSFPWSIRDAKAQRRETPETRRGKLRLTIQRTQGCMRGVWGKPGKRRTQYGPTTDTRMGALVVSRLLPENKKVIMMTL